MPRICAAATALALGAASACSSAPEPRPEPRPAPRPASDRAGETPSRPPVEPSLPAAASRFAPAHTRLDEASPIDGAHLADVDSCDACHPDVAAQWASSAHAFASFNNPIYRVAINGFRDQVSATASRFCAGCHDVAPLIDGAMDAAIDPQDARAHAGITCRVCHGVTAARADGNGSFTLGAEPIYVPRDDEPASIARHRRQVSRAGLGARLCLPCHRSFLGPDTGNGHHLTGMDDYTAWQSSAHAGHGVARIDDPVPRRDCIDCHMAREPAVHGDAAAEDGTIASHRFLGGHTWLAAMLGDDEQLARARRLLRGAASIDIATATSRGPAGGLPRRALPADGAAVIPGGELELDVVVRNLEVGHRFPAGVRDAQDTWIEVTVRDARGRVVAQSGRAHRAGPTTAEIGAAHVLRSLVADDRGHILLGRQVHRFRAGVVDHTIAPRDAAVIRYAAKIPEGVAQPLSIDARLLHRTRNLHLQALACREARSPAGREFARGSRRARGAALDPCPPQPVTTIAETRVWVGQGWRDRAARESHPAPAWRRLYEHGMAWIHAVQERLDEARPSLEAALAELEARGRPGRPGDREVRARTAMVLAALARVAGRQGRTGEALMWLDRARELLPGGAAHPALAWIRGTALMRVWRWREAEAPLARAVARSPANSRAWRDLAVTLGSLGKHAGALAAARRGLALNPRAGALLRVQALALRGLDAPRAGEALAAYNRFRAPDRAAGIRFACAARAPACARERQPVHVHRLRPPGGSPEPSTAPRR